MSDDGSPIAGIGHVAIKVADVERTLRFYREAFGFGELMRLNRDDGTLWLVYLRITDTQFLEVFPGARGTQAPDEDANGLNHLCLEVGDMDAALARLDAAGIEPFRPRRRGLDGNEQAWVRDPDGNRIELMRMSPDGMQRRAILERRLPG